MKTAIYIVINARSAWWVDLDGESEGPYQALDSAIRRAVERATETSGSGGRSEVRVAGPDRASALVYQSVEKSLLGRAVAMAHR
jgi:hypothetical protein